MGGCGYRGNYNMGDFLSGYEGGEYNYQYKAKKKKNHVMLDSLMRVWHVRLKLMRVSSQKLGADFSGGWIGGGEREIDYKSSNQI